MEDNAGIVLHMAEVGLPGDRVPTEAEVRELVARLAGAMGLDPAATEEVVQTIMARRLVRMDTGSALVEPETHRPWLEARRAGIDPHYWSKYRRMLERDGWLPQVLGAMGRSTDEILDLCGDPLRPAPWSRRGLVMGDVQSGKTATYNALICKAADAGYKFIVLLAGTIENLRRQTQERMDEGFVGRDSRELLKRNSRDVQVGVGFIDNTRNAVVFTSSSTDFKSTTRSVVGLSLASLNEPALVVVKKNARILSNLVSWIRDNNVGAQAGALDLPFLLIDDEADNASINTNDTDQDPTRINTCIRSLLSLFNRNTYLGFTATPFANIFVNPESHGEMLSDDLFPRDFIYTLQAPSNYFGYRKVFGEEGDEEADSPLRPIEDAEEYLPRKHRSTHTVDALPPSLLDALDTFLISNTIRDLRGEGATHRSMLVNVSQFTRVQDQVEDLLRMELENIQTDVRAFAGLPVDQALKSRSLARLKAALEREYPDCGFAWKDVQGVLPSAALPVTTRAVNQRTGPSALDYKAYKDGGLRVVAVGGNSLARGLTLEGLVVSYFRRTTRMYDTLMQMGRWFGYRPGYEDLCRVWIPEESRQWYGHIGEATDELKREFLRMRHEGKGPKDYGLAVRAHPQSLLVTARNKMRSAKDYTRVVTVSGQSIESVELPANAEALLANWKLVESFLERVVSLPGVVEIQENGPRVLRGVPAEMVASLVRGFKVSKAEILFRPELVGDLLDGHREGKCAFWDVAIPEGTAATLVTLGGRQVHVLKRSNIKSDEDGFLISGRNRRVGSRGDEAAGLSREDRERAKEKAHEDEIRDAEKDGRDPLPANKLNLAGRHYRAVRPAPLLLIHAIDPGPVVESGALRAMPEGTALAALGLSLPEIDGAQPLAIRYKINPVKFRELDNASPDEPDDYIAGEGDPA